MPISTRETNLIESFVYVAGTKFKSHLCYDLSD
jgi:hypothetical protein